MSDRANGAGNPEQSGKAIEVMKLISKTEADGVKKRELAVNEARLIIAEATERAKKSAEFEDAKAAEKIGKIKQLTEEKSRELAINILTQVNGECEELKNTARQRKADAVTAVVERIVNEWR